MDSACATHPENSIASGRFMSRTPNGVRRPRFPERRGNFGDSAINKGYIEHFSLRMSERAVILTSGLISDARRVPSPRFRKRRENFGDSRTFKADIGLLNICMGFRTS